MLCEPSIHLPIRKWISMAAAGLLTTCAAAGQAQIPAFPTATSQAHNPLLHGSVPRSTYSQLPLSFEQNSGQAASDVRFLAHGRGYSVELTSSEARLALLKSVRGRKSVASQGDLLRLQLVGAAAGTAARGTGVLPGTASYFIGNDASKWKVGIPTYKRVSYSGVYPGIDLVYYGDQKQLEYDFVVAPGSNPAKIAMNFAGAKKISVNSNGQLLVGLSGGFVRWNKPVIYQQVHGKRKPVAGKYVMRGANKVGFEVARYDTRQPLTIDPVLIYSTYLGGSGDDQAYAVAVDSAGSAYVTGKTKSQNFPGTTGGFPGASRGFVTKFAPNGGSILYSVFIGGNNDTNCWAIKVDGSGNAYIAGDTTATDFPVVKGFQATDLGGTDGYVARLNANATALVYSTYLGGTDTDTAQGIALGPSGDAYVTGYTSSTDFPVTGNAYQATNFGGSDAIVTRVNTNASGAASLVYSTFVGGSFDERAFGIAVDGTGRIYITGDTQSSDFPIVFGYQPTLLSFMNAFVCVLEADGSQVSYSSYLGGTGTDSGLAIAVDRSRNAYVTGSTSSVDFPKRNPLQPVLGGADDVFVTKFNCAATGDASLVYSTYLGGLGEDVGNAIAVDVWGNAYVAGDTDAGFVPFTNSKGFIVKISRAGNSLLFGTVVGGSTSDSNLGLAVDPYGNAFVTGITTSIDFPISPNAFQQNFGGVKDAFVYKLPTFTNLDLNHDNYPDLLFQNQSDSRLVYWLMKGDRELKLGFIFPTTPGIGWNVGATAELNGNSDTDIIFQNSTSGDMAYWLMNGTSMSQLLFISPKNPGTNWKLVASADFNGDGYADLLFQNSATGDLYEWNMNGGTMISGGFITPTNPGPGWQVVAVGDLNGDGQPDILFQHNTSGNLYVWFLHGTTMFAGGFVNPANPGTGWNVAALTDLDGDGQKDIVFQNSSTGQIAYWSMDGASMVYLGFPRPSNPGGAVWKLVAPH